MTVEVEGAEIAVEKEEAVEESVAVDAPEGGGAIAEVEHEEVSIFKSSYLCSFYLKQLLFNFFY